MNLHLVAQKAFPHWNKRVVTERDVRRVCHNKGVRIVEGKTGVSGLYVVYRGVPFIVIDPDLGWPLCLWVLLHELAHHLLHVPGLQFFDNRFESKADYEANFIAAVALMPLDLIKRLTFAEIQDEYGYPSELMWFRKEIYEQFGI